VNELAARLSARTVNHAYLRLRAALKIAVKEKHMAENVALDIVLPRVQSNKTSQALTVEQVRAFLQVVAGHRLETLFFAAITLGFREGELLGLLWSDIDLERATVMITGNLQAVRGKLVRLTSKTEASKRTLDLSPQHIECLRQHWQNQQEEKAISERKAAQKARETGETPRPWNEAGYVFCSETGTPIWPTNFYGDFKRFAARAGLPDDVRHTAGSLMIEDGESIVTVSEVLGHSNPSVTAKVYSHGYRESRKRATGSLVKKLRRSE
jgi:integrase